MRTRRVSESTEYLATASCKNQYTYFKKKLINIYVVRLSKIRNQTKTTFETHCVPAPFAARHTRTRHRTLAPASISDAAYRRARKRRNVPDVLVWRAAYNRAHSARGFGGCKFNCMPVPMPRRLSRRLRRVSERGQRPGANAPHTDQAQCGVGRAW